MHNLCNKKNGRLADNLHCSGGEERSTKYFAPGKKEHS